MSKQYTMVDMVNTCSPADWTGDHSECMTLDSVVDVKQFNKCKLTPDVSVLA